MVYLYVVGIFLILALASYSAIHALTNKRDPRAAFSWIAVCFILPLLGPLLYFLFGINRVRSRAQKLSHSLLKIDSSGLDKKSINTLSGFIPETLQNLQYVSHCVTGSPVIGGNNIDILYSGHQTYPAMLKAIRESESYIYLCVYIFKLDKVGEQFIHALVAAKNRGVEVFILIDGIGEFYSWKKARKALNNFNIQVRSFLPPKLIPFNFYINLRNHRKLLVVDDKISFIGGMNISDEYFHEDKEDKHSLKDVHFKVTGPITLQFKKVFESDWHFAGGKNLSVKNNHTIDAKTEAPIYCRAISDGPAENIDHLSIILLTAINSATDTIMLMTPYFLPSRELISAMHTAAIRGVKISIILPEKNNLSYVSWASRHMLWELLEIGIDIYMQPEPFEHSKLFIVDYQYSLVGSANIDPRSLRLNYEIAMEVYDKKLTTDLSQYFQAILQSCSRMTLEEVNNRRLIIKIRDGIAWLFSPYL